jgi:hypothetical protein
LKHAEAGGRIKAARGVALEGECARCGIIRAAGVGLQCARADGGIAGPGGVGVKGILTDRRIAPAAGVFSQRKRSGCSVETA